MCFFHIRSPGGKPGATLKSGCLKKIKGDLAVGGLGSWDTAPEQGFSKPSGSLNSTMCRVSSSRLPSLTGEPISRKAGAAREGLVQEIGLCPQANSPIRPPKCAAQCCSSGDATSEPPRGVQDRCRTLKSRQRSEAALLPVEKDHGSGRSAKLRAVATHAGIQRAGLVGKTVRREI